MWNYNALLIDFRDVFHAPPRDRAFYLIHDGNDNTNLAWANCAPPDTNLVATITWINGSSGLPMNKPEEDSRVEHLIFPIRGVTFYQFRVYNATQSEAGRWACQATTTIGTRLSYFSVEVYGMIFLIYLLLALDFRN